MDDDVSLSDMIRDLQEAKMGDSGRLAYILDRIENGRTIYSSDKNYVREKFNLMRKGLFDEPGENPEDAPEETLKGVPEDAPEEVPKGVAESPKPSQTVTDKPSKAWYVLPIFLGILGGLIAFAALRKRNRRSAYKNLGVGIGITMILPAIVLIGILSDDSTHSTFPQESISEYSDAEIKSLAVSVPYQSLVDQPDTHYGEMVWYEGTLIQVKKQFFDEYLLRVGVTQERFGASDVLLLTYTPKSDEEKTWLDKAENELKPGQIVDHETVKFWGISQGLAEYDTVFGQTVTIPEIDVILIERQMPNVSDSPDVDPEPQVTGTQSGTRHTVGFSDIPGYVDESIVERAVIDAVREWDMANPDVDFVVVESDADVSINWARYMPGSSLGLHQATVTDDGDRRGHSITVRLGIDDCHSEYRQFAHGALQYTIAHEVGHYLGLRHIEDNDHLMYSGELLNVDAARIYDDLGLGIPDLERPEIATVAGMGLQSQIDALDADLAQISAQRQELKDSGASLVANTEHHNEIVSQIQELEDQLTCVSLP